MTLEHEPGKRRLLVIGSSRTRDSVQVIRLGKQLRRRGSPIDESYNLCINWLRPAHALALLDHVPTDGEGIVLLEVSAIRLRVPTSRVFEREDERGPRLGVRSSTYDDLRRSADYPVTPPVGLFLLDNQRFYVRRLHRGAQRWWLGHRPPRYAVASPRRARSHRDFRRINAQLDKLRELPGAEQEAIIDENLEQLEAAVKAARARGLEVFLYRVPLNPAFDRRYGISSWNAPIHRRVQAIAERHQATVVEAPKLGVKAFRDMWHVRLNKHRSRVTRHLAKRIAQANN